MLFHYKCKVVEQAKYTYYEKKSELWRLCQRERRIDCEEEVVEMMEMFNISIKRVDYTRYAFKNLLNCLLNIILLYVNFTFINCKRKLKLS